MKIAFMFVVYKSVSIRNGLASGQFVEGILRVQDFQSPLELAELK
jgi:hypothetical protein